MFYPEGFLTILEAAEFVGIHRSNLQKLAIKNVITRYKPAYHVSLFKLTDLIELKKKIEDYGVSSLL